VGIVCKSWWKTRRERKERGPKKNLFEVNDWKTDLNLATKKGEKATPRKAGWRIRKTSNEEGKIGENRGFGGLEKEKAEWGRGKSKHTSAVEPGCC